MAARVPKTIWWVYLVRCADHSLYCGISSDLSRRVGEHNASPKAARYTRSRRPVSLAWFAIHATRSAALKREHKIKQLTRREKEKLVVAMSPSKIKKVKASKVSSQNKSKK